MESEFFIFDSIDIDISQDEVLAQLGYPSSNSASARVRKRLKLELDKGIPLIEPKGAYLLVDAEKTALAPFVHPGKMVLALATAGKPIGDRAAKLVKSKLAASGSIADAIGTIAAEKTADFIESEIRRKFTAKGCRISRRFAPGHCNWGIQDQMPLLSCFPDTLGISLTQSCLMIPEKSLSFLCLINNTGDFDWVKLGNCRHCDSLNCTYRQHRLSGDSQDK